MTADPSRRFEKWRAVSNVGHKIILLLETFLNMFDHWGCNHRGVRLQPFEGNRNQQRRCRQKGHCISSWAANATIRKVKMEIVPQVGLQSQGLQILPLQLFSFLQIVYPYGYLPPTMRHRLARATGTRLGALRRGGI